jgi:hypothetical protein
MLPPASDTGWTERPMVADSQPIHPRPQTIRTVGRRLQSNAVTPARITTQTNAHPMLYAHWTEHQTTWSVKKVVRPARRYCTVHISAGRQTNTAADPLSDDLREAITAIHSPVHVHQFGPSRVLRARGDIRPVQPNRPDELNVRSASRCQTAHAPATPAYR